MEEGLFLFTTRITIINMLQPLQWWCVQNFLSWDRQAFITEHSVISSKRYTGSVRTNCQLVHIWRMMRISELNAWWVLLLPFIYFFSGVRMNRSLSPVKKAKTLVFRVLDFHATLPRCGLLSNSFRQAGQRCIAPTSYLLHMSVLKTFWLLQYSGPYRFVPAAL